LTSIWFPFFSREPRTTPLTNFVPYFSIYFPILSVISSSKPLRSLDLTATETSSPIPYKKPAHSRATYPAPTTKVFPGDLVYQKRSSEVMHNSPPLMLFASLGLPPTAKQNLAAVLVTTPPYSSVNYTVCSSRKVP